MDPKPGDVVHVGARASVQFGGDRALVFRVIKVCDKPTYHGWVWLTGYVLDRTGKAVDRREIYVQHEGLRLIGPTAAADARRIPTPANQPARQRPARTARTTV
ncbi:hypothetical protein GA0070606_2821 [Micromonospora citrea]|uniref:Uncharacterized protein n=1 Tax=Micromonospora citrea TaxID=47855 RepID=A0A1C6UUL6_9ACTN|nr:hypothetical protein [Micromonospora citrea]SCL57737.1 hypothetical protein GA0070606_2821 [Micromonospora citrea]